jgi:uncharacterized membrane protein YeaQ/YmgE (transglycosylase-associated protein family)
MTLVRFPSARRGYFLGIVAGLITCLGATVAGKLLIDLGLHADLTYLDDVLLGVLVALLVLVLHHYYDTEKSLHQEKIASLIAVHKSIAADLQTIAAVTGNTALAEIANDAAAKIQATIAELPTAQELLSEEKRVATQKAQRRLA